MKMQKIHVIILGGMHMKKLFILLLAMLLMYGCALGEAVVEDDGDDVLDLAMTDVVVPTVTVVPKPVFEPIPWELDVSPNPPIESCYLPDDSGYHDDSLDIQVEKLRAFDTTVMVVRVQLADVSQFRTGLSTAYPHKKEVVVSTMARKAKAVLAMNSDFFMYHDEGVAVRNGRSYRQIPRVHRDILVVDWNGDFHIIRRPTKEMWEPYKEMTLHAFSFGPALVVDGEPLTDASEITLDIGKNKKTQRIAIAQTEHLQYMIIATEGPENKGSTGVTIVEMAQICSDLGCQNAYNLDGGSSSTVVLNNHKINSLSSGKIRPVGDFIWFATLVPTE